jgi:AcrR family transcriptional regulator
VEERRIEQAKAGRRRTKGMRRRKEIIRTAREIFSQKGFAETRVTDITEKAGIAKGTLYLYFRSKEELFLAVIRDAAERLRHSVAEALHGVEDPLERVRISVPVIFDTCRREAALYLAIFQQSTFVDNEHAAEMQALYEPLAYDFQKTIEEGVEKGVFHVGDPQILSHGVFGFLASLIHRWLLMEASGKTPEGYVEKMTDTVSRFFCYGLVGTALPEPDEIGRELRKELGELLSRTRKLRSRLEEWEDLLSEYE